jgi:oxalate---CoA ligase
VRDTIYSLIEQAANQTPDAVALLAPGHRPLSYHTMLEVIGRFTQQLRSGGISRQDCVALVLPDGLLMAVAFLGTGASAICAPLNPRYKAAEYRSFLSDLAAKVIITVAGYDEEVRIAAGEMQIPVWELPAEPWEVGIGNASAAIGLALPAFAPPAPEDIALILHTSGTTAQPKQVALTQLNLAVSAQQIARTLQLVSADRALNVMPLFHIHGLVGSLLSSLVAGASVVCTPGFDATRFWDWLVEYQPTWYSAVPTMHQSILARLKQAPIATQIASLRFIRSSSAPLPPVVMQELEAAFGVPVIEAYGMTEAAHQMASNPLPPALRKAGSVGLPAGPEIAIMDADGHLSAVGARGEVVIRGTSVFGGYVNNPEANAQAFANGWFRTGDLGEIDASGYLFLLGRNKEIINRGGEKISPHEVDEVLLAHPAVAQAVTFAIPDPRLGQEIAAAVVLRTPGVTTNELRRFTAAHLADFKVPRQIVILAEIPKGPTGKVQRIGLAKQLGLEQGRAGAPADAAEPTSLLETCLWGLWSDVLALPHVGVHDHFIDVGGDSILAMRLVNRIRDVIGLPLNVVDFFEAPTIAEQAVVLERMLRA